MRISSLIAAGVLAVSSFVTVAQAQMNFDPNAHQRPQRHHVQPQQPHVRPAPPVAAPPVFHAPRHVAPQPQVHHQPRIFHHQPRAMPFPVIVPQTQYVDRPVYIQEQPQYYAPQQRYYDDEPVYRPRRAQRCRTVLARDQWGGRHYVKKCRPVGRRYR